MRSRAKPVRDDTSEPLRRFSSKHFLKVELVPPMQLGGNGKKEFCCKDFKTFWQTWKLESLTVKMHREVCNHSKGILCIKNELEIRRF